MGRIIVVEGEGEEAKSWEVLKAAQKKGKVGESGRMSVKSDALPDCEATPQEVVQSNRRRTRGLKKRRDGVRFVFIGWGKLKLYFVS